MNIKTSLIIIIIATNVIAFSQNWYSDLFKFEKTISEITELVSPSVVVIANVNNSNEIISFGSGFIIRENGVILTNFHVINGANKLLVKLADDTIYDVEGIIDFDPDIDYAILKIKVNNLRFVSIGATENLKIGTKTVAIGSPLGFEYTVSDGIISQVRHNGNYSLIQTTTPITFGSSGGPLLNLYGEAIGITTAGFEGGGNIGFAIPLHHIKGIKANNLSVKYSMTQFLKLYGDKVATQNSTGTHLSDSDGNWILWLIAIWLFWGILPPA